MERHIEKRAGEHVNASQGGAIQPHDPGGLRISDDDRHKVAEVLREAAGDGRIDLSELDERLDAAYSAKTYAELVPITADLPAHETPHPALAPRPAESLVPAVGHANSFAVMSEIKRAGVWSVEAHHSAFAMMGSITIDLREARFEVNEVVISAVAIMAEVKVIVNPGTVVVVDGMGIMGEFSESRSKAAAELTQQSPVVRVKGFALMGSVIVQRKAMPSGSDSRKRLGWSGS